MPQYFICSKGRAGKTSTDKLLEEIPVDYAFVVEPQEAEEYARNLRPHGSIIVLPEGGRGLPYSRERTKEAATGGGQEFFAVLDDDIKGFAEVKDGKTTKASPAVLLAGMEYFKTSGLALMSFEYQQYAWSQKGIVSTEKACDCCVFFNTKRTRDVHFDETMRLKGDREYCLQLAMRGQRFGRMNRYAISVPSLGTNIGGLHDEYRRKEDERYAVKLYKRYGPKVCKLVRKKDGRIDVKIDFKKFYE